MKYYFYKFRKKHSWQIPGPFCGCILIPSAGELTASLFGISYLSRACLKAEKVVFKLFDTEWEPVSNIFCTFPLKKNHFLYLDWLIIRKFYVNLYSRTLIHI